MLRTRKKYYQSLTMGNLVTTRREVIQQVFQQLFKFRTLDIKWRKIEQVEEV